MSENEARFAFLKQFGIIGLLVFWIGVSEILGRTEMF